jgi:DNA-binding IclR family transcriptional regulator
MSGDTLQSVTRAVGLLEAIAEEPGTSAQYLSQARGLQLATTYHILKTLLVHGYLTKDGKGYRLGPAVGVLAAALERDLQPDLGASVVIRRLAESVGETVYLSRWLQGDVVISAVAEGRHPVRVSGVHVGLRGHAYARASGKALLAFGPPERLRGYMAVTTLQPLTPNTPDSPERLLAEIEATRSRGYAVDNEEFATGVSCISVPVGPEGPAGASIALTASMPAGRYESVREKVVDALRAAADELTHGAVGGVGTSPTRTARTADSTKGG